MGSESIRLVDAHRRLYHQQELQAGDGQGECDTFLANDSGDEDDGKEAQLEDQRRVLDNTGAQLSHVNIGNGVVDTPNDIQDEDYEFIPSEQQTRSSGVIESHRVWAVWSTLSSKAGIILVSPPYVQSN